MGEAGTLMTQDAANRFPVTRSRSGFRDVLSATARWFVQGFEQPPSGIMHGRDLRKLRRARATAAKIEATPSSPTSNALTRCNRLVKKVSRKFFLSASKPSSGKIQPFALPCRD
jgi:hypothetical protein